MSDLLTLTLYDGDMRALDSAEVEHGWNGDIGGEILELIDLCNLYQSHDAHTREHIADCAARDIERDSAGGLIDMPEGYSVSYMVTR